MHHQQVPCAKGFRSRVAPQQVSPAVARIRKPPAAAAAGHTTNVTFKIRRAKAEDAQAVADLYSEVFGAGNFPGLEDNPLLHQVESNYAAAVGRESSDKLAEALSSKAQAALAHRMYRLNRQAAMLKGQLLMAQGLPATFPTEGPTELRQAAKWRRARSFVCLVMEAAGEAADGSSAALLGTATLSMMQAEAALPPPFPSSAPLRAYISNMAVSQRFRRQGIAKTLVGACGRIARAWGQPAVLLHVAADNTAAQRLYLECGFEAVPNSQGLSGLIKGPWTQQRMVADPAVLAARYHRRSGSCSRSTSGLQQQVSSPSVSRVGGIVAGSAVLQQRQQQHWQDEVSYPEDEEEYSSSCELLWSARSPIDDANSST